MSERNRLAEGEARQEALRAVDLEQARTAFDRIAFLVQCFAETPIAQVEIIDGGHIWRTGVSDTPLPVEAARKTFASRAAAGDRVLWVEDAQRDRRFSGAALRFYAGAPIKLSNGDKIGAVSIADRRPRPFDAYLAARLEDFAAFAAEEWDRLRAVKDLRLVAGEASTLTKQMVALVDGAPVALVMTDTELNVLRVSKSWLAQRGMQGMNVVGRSLQELFPDRHEQRKEAYRVALAGETVRWEQLSLNLPDGRRPWVRGEVAPWRGADGAVGGLLVISHDITDMADALAASEQSEQRLRIATEMAEVLVWEASYAERRMKTFGHAIGAMGNIDVNDDVETNLWRAVHPADRPTVEALWKRCLETGAQFRTTYRITQPNGPHTWVAAAAEATRDDDGQIERIVGVLKNIDREKRNEHAMARALEAAEAANRAKSEFLANMSHEIRNPLNGVMGIASVLGRTDLTPTQREMVDLIVVSAQTLEALLSDVLDLARIEAGRLELRDEPFDLGDVLRSTAAMFEAKAAEKGLALKTVISPAAKAEVRGDMIRIRQIVSNLLSNAVKFTEEGRVSLHVEATRGGQSLHMRVSVIDTGIGFDEEAGRRLFQRFEQADGSITRRFGGTGLGLSISNSLAEAMGGALSASASPGEGSVFTLDLELPLAETPVAHSIEDDLAEAIEQAADAKLAAGARAIIASPADPLDAGATEASGLTHEQSGPAQRPIRILLAEDHPTNRKVVSLMLEAISADLTCVETGEAAVLAVERDSYDVILMDVQMPLMDGLTATSIIRQREAMLARPRTPILALTANAMAEDMQATSAAGVDGHLTKPLAADKLLGAIRDVCPHHCSEDSDTKASRAVHS
jgi:PAS domain S-box-containing protein